MADIMTKPVKRLYDLEIDEISLVDRPANQHGLVAIAKRDEDNDMPEIFGADGDAVDEDSLEHGDVVYDASGNEYVFVEDGQELDLEQEPEAAADQERELISVGKRAKGLGAEVYEALSKALSTEDRDGVVSKIAQEVEVTKRENEELRTVLTSLLEDRDLEQYTEIAKGYNLPIQPEKLGRILKSAAATMTDDDLAELDRLLVAQGELYEEIGTAGSAATSQVMDQVNAMALETVGKADVSVPQAVVALFEANPAAYDEYLAENG